MAAPSEGRSGDFSCGSHDDWCSIWVVEQSEAPMEKWRTEWKSIEGRIVGLETTASLVLRASGMHSNGLSIDALSNNALRPVLIDLLDTLIIFHESYAAMLPTQASEHVSKGLGRAFGVIGREPS